MWGKSPVNNSWRNLECLISGKNTWWIKLRIYVSIKVKWNEENFSKGKRNSITTVKLVIHGHQPAQRQVSMADKSLRCPHMRRLRHTHRDTCRCAVCGALEGQRPHSYLYGHTVSLWGRYITGFCPAMDGRSIQYLNTRLLVHEE